MSRAERLLDLLQLLRRHRRAAVTGAAMATELGISRRTLYRDIATLQAQGVHIEGAPGLGYALRPGAILPPLTLSANEIEALVLGCRWVVARGDAELREAAVDLLAKIAAVMPTDSRHAVDASPLLVGPSAALTADDAVLATVRAAIRREHKLLILYRDAAAAETRRTIWPFALGYFDRAQVVIAWCESREAVRHFRSDRIAAVEPTDCRYPERRQALLTIWRRQQGIAPPD